LDLSLALKGARRVVVVGIGSDLRGDDAAGVEVVRRLRARLSSPRVKLIEAGVAPENFTADIIRFEPSHVVLIDATDLGLEPGGVALVDPETIVGESISTHHLPLSILIKYLRERVDTNIVFIGIQPASRAFGAVMSEGVRKAVDEVVGILFKKLNSI
jgi:hydrogenase 3 maturation protease